MNGQVLHAPDGADTLLGLKIHQQLSWQLVRQQVFLVQLCLLMSLVMSMQLPPDDQLPVAITGQVPTNSGMQKCDLAHIPLQATLKCNLLHLSSLELTWLAQPWATQQV